MGFRDFAGALDDEGFGRVKRRIVSRPCRDFRNVNGRDLAGVIQIVARFVEVVFGFRRHRSRPSRRNSCINPVRSR